jgi:hypothetical protein
MLHRVLVCVKYVSKAQLEIGKEVTSKGVCSCHVCTRLAFFGRRQGSLRGIFEDFVLRYLMRIQRQQVHIAQVSSIIAYWLGNVPEEPRCVSEIALIATGTMYALGGASGHASSCSDPCSCDMAAAASSCLTYWTKPQPFVVFWSLSGNRLISSICASHALKSVQSGHTRTEVTGRSEVFSDCASTSSLSVGTTTDAVASTATWRSFSTATMEGYLHALANLR